MTGFQTIGVLIIRLWAASILITTVMNLIVVFWGAVEETEFVPWLAQSSAWLTAAIIAWIAAPRLSRAALPNSVQGAEPIAIGEQELIVAGSFLIGMFYLVETGPRLVASLGDFLAPFVSRESDELPHVRSLNWQFLAQNFLTFAAALFLTFRPRQLARLFGALRVAGLAKMEPET